MALAVGCGAALATASVGSPASAAVSAGALTSIPNAPVFVQEAIPGGALMSWAVVDPNVTDLRTAVASGPGCRAPGAGGGCTSTVAALAVPLRGVAAVNANYTNGDVPLGLAVADHVEVGADDLHTTTLCLADRDVHGHAAIAIGKGFTASACRTAVSGESLVSAGAALIEGSGDEGNPARFWFRVDDAYRVERTLVGLRADGSLIIGVASSDHSGGRAGVTLPEAATWLILHGAVQGIALDGGHMSNAWVAGPGDISPLESGRPPVKTALVLVPVVWRFALTPPVPAPPVAVAATPPPPPVGHPGEAAVGDNSLAALPLAATGPPSGMTRMRAQFERLAGGS